MNFFQVASVIELALNFLDEQVQTNETRLAEAEVGRLKEMLAESDQHVKLLESKIMSADAAVCVR